MAEEEENDLKAPEPKKSSIVPTIIALVIVTGAAAGAGWFLSGMLSESKMTETAEVMPAKEAKKEEGKESKDKKDPVPSGGVVKLDPLIVKLDRNNTFLRLELALIAKEDVNLHGEETKARIGAEIATFARTLTLQQISGPSGYLHLREDLLDRAQLATEGQIKDLLIMSMVAE